MDRTAVGYFQDRSSADRAYDLLIQRGFAKNDISIVGRGAEGKPGLVDAGHEGHDVSAGEGAATGGIVGLLLGAAAMLIPGIGPVVAVGPLAAGLAGALTGGVTGAIVGGITGGARPPRGPGRGGAVPRRALQAGRLPGDRAHR